MGAAAETTERFVETNGVRLRLLEAGERGAPVVLLAHGFPELAVTWRHQIGALADAGFHVLAPDQRGYGGSSCPAAVEDYDVVALTDDWIGLLDDVGADRAAIVGHDWGATLAWSFPLLHPDRVAAVAGLSQPPIPRSKVPTTQAFRRIFGDGFFYQLYFQQPEADADLDRDPATTLRRLFADTWADSAPSAPADAGFVDRLAEPGQLPDWITESEFDSYTAEFKRTGFRGGLNWYRNMDRNWELLGAAPTATITAPALFLGGTADPALAFTRTDRARQVVTGPYREEMIDGAGHWLQQERPAEITAALSTFLRGVEL